ncbi:DUF1801 domain-containing protein [Gordonia sihwensis]|uniref:DUF1801 domain-containing protein n=1 Tax=Gordonia TaxID=2053 RepID=UPI00241596AE|nr:DUF1801 domain-containing protein [Gordonia sihwensis]WFN91327.1 DUF1801 domain-containing protein [Gordonia sihwensis]
MTKTAPGDDSVDAYLAAVTDQRRRDDARLVVRLFREVTGTEPVMWGSMVGFGRHRYQTADGRSHETFAVGLAARRQALTIYGVTYDGSNSDLLARLGPHSTGKGCLYVKRVDAVDTEVLRELVARGWHANQSVDADDCSTR